MKSYVNLLTRCSLFKNLLEITFRVLSPLLKPTQTFSVLSELFFSALKVSLSQLTSVRAPLFVCMVFCVPALPVSTLSPIIGNNAKRTNNVNPLSWVSNHLYTVGNKTEKEAWKGLLWGGSKFGVKSFTFCISTSQFRQLQSGAIWLDVIKLKKIASKRTLKPHQIFRSYDDMGRVYLFLGVLLLRQFVLFLILFFHV